MNKFKKLRKITAFIVTLAFVLGTAAVLYGGKSESVGKSGAVSLPVIMYHSLLKDKNLQNDYVVSPSIFEADLKYLTENGYTTVVVEDLTDYVYSGRELPKKCVMLTFDDGYYNNLCYALPLLEKYGCKAVISPIASESEKYSQSGDISPSYGYITFDDMKSMAASGCVEIQNHTYNMHLLTPRNGASKKGGESEEDYRDALTNDVEKAQRLLKAAVGKTPSCFVYPFGAESDTTAEIIKEMGFSCTLTCTEKPNTITRDPESLFELGRYRRDADETMQTLLARISAD